MTRRDPNAPVSGLSGPGLSGATLADFWSWAYSDLLDRSVRQALAQFVVGWTLDNLAQLDFTHIIMGHGDVTGREWLNTFRSYVADMVEAVRTEAATGATLDEVKQRVTAKLAPRYEKPFSAYGEYRPWRTGLAANIERTFGMVS